MPLYGFMGRAGDYHNWFRGISTFFWGWGVYLDAIVDEMEVRELNTTSALFVPKLV